MHEIEGTNHVTVVGAGLVGSLLSMYLARRGFQVEVLERRPDMRREEIGAGRSINLAISARGLYALRQVGLEEEALRQAIPMRGRMIHAPSGELAFQAYGKDESQHINSLSRAWLNKYLMTHAERSGRVRIQFEQRVQHVDFEKGVLEVLDRSGSAVREVHTPVVFGTDGSGSAVRREMVLRPGHVSEQEHLSHGYKELTIPAGPGGTFRMEKHALHIWPRGSYMLIALPNQDGSFTCTLFLPFQGPVSFESLETPAQVEAFFQEQFPDALELIPGLTHDFFHNPTGTMVTVKSGARHRALLRAGDELRLRGLRDAGCVPGEAQAVGGRLRGVLPAAQAERGRHRGHGGGELRGDAGPDGGPALPAGEGGGEGVAQGLPGRVPEPLHAGELQPGAVPSVIRGGGHRGRYRH